MTRLLRYITCISLLLLCKNGRAQAPVNDNCENASQILIPGSGFDFDTISSLAVNVYKATRQAGEHCAAELEENGNCVKTIWYKFYLPTTRNVGIKLTQQDSAIPQIFSGFNIYRIKDCSYTISDFANQLTPLNKFGTSGNACLGQGWYLVQIGCKQKAKGEIWLDLEVSKPASESYDSITGLHDFRIQFGGNAYKRFNMECASVDLEEAVQLGDSNCSKSVWLACRIEPNSEQSGLFINGPVKYRIFYDNIDPDSIKSNKPFMHLDQAGDILYELCPGFSTGRNYFVQVVAASGVKFVDISFESRMFKADPWNTPNTNEFIDLLPNTFNIVKHTYNCESKLESHACKNAVPKSYIKSYLDYNYFPSKKITDTFRYAGYTILNVTEDGMLLVKSSYTNSKQVFALYEGDIRSSCQLNFISDTLVRDSRSLTQCVGKGIYTLVVASGRIGSYIELTIQLKVEPASAPKYSYPSTPEKLPDYKPSDRAYIVSEVSSFREQDTAITISNMTFRGGFIYREIYFSEGGEVDIGIPNDQNNYDGSLYIFSGQLSKGTVSAIPTFDYKRYFRSSSDIAEYSGGHKRCFYLSKGHYTIIAWNGYRPQYDKLLPCMSTKNMIYIRPNPVCPSYTNTEPQFAIPVNRGKNVFDTLQKDPSNNYTYGLLSCNTCSSRSFVIPATSCQHKSYLTPYSTYHYYTFYLDENASVSLSTNAYELYEGNVLTDPGIIKDTSRIIDPCDNGMLICNLEGKKSYTLVLFNQQNSLYGYTLNFSKLRVSANDFADHAFDMGHVSGDTVVSPYFPMTCHTTSFISDPAPPGKAGASGVTAVHFPDTLNAKKTSLNKRNLWFTFTSAGGSDLSIRLKMFSNYYYQGNYYYAYVLKYKGNYHSDFKDVLLDNFDSTMKSMEPVLHVPVDNSHPFINFTNPGCRDNRYFVLVYDNKSDNNYWDMKFVQDFGLEVISKVEPHTVNGDQCHSAVTGQYSQAGKYILKADNGCHTFGKSIFEEDEDPAVKSTWFKIHIDSLDKFDLKVRNLNSKGLMRYNVYGGTCKAMTRIARQGDRYAYFILSCMGKGDYFIQAICDMSISEELQFEVTLIDAGQAPCKPYDFKYPIAQFDYRGGCHTNDSIIFRNLSTKGDDMEYFWYLNGKLFSIELNPLQFRNSPDMLPLDTFRLIVLNTAENIRDTFDLAYKKDTTIYKFNIDGPATVLCRDTLRLKVKTNYNEKLNYTWYSDKHVQNNQALLLSTYPGYQQDRVFDATYYLYGESDNCHFTDSLHVRVLNSLKRYRDSSYCSWNPYMIKNTHEYYSWYVMWPVNAAGTTYDIAYIEPKESYTIPKSGLYMVRYMEGNCFYLDTMNISIEPGLKFLHVTENIYTCNVPSRQMGYAKDTLQHYYWNTGDTTRFITATKNGTYRLSGPFSKCSSLDYTAYLSLEKLNTNMLRDTVVCKNDDFPFRNPYGSNFKVLYKEPNMDTLHITGPVKQVLKVQRSECNVEDSAMINIFPYAGRTIDSFYCDDKLKFSMYLNGGDAQKYNWYKNQETNRFLQIYGYGNYPVARIDPYGCKDTLNFNVITSCEFTVFVPSAFSPNDDYTNESFGPVISGFYSKFDMVLFNNWGEIVFRTDSNQFWDGFYKDTYTQGVYCYIITVYDRENKPFKFKGTVTLLY